VGQEAGVILLYVLGMALAVAEIFLPGVVVGLIGLGMICTAIYLGFNISAAMGWTLTVLTVVSIPVYAIFWVKVLNRMFAMNATQKGYTSAQTELKVLVGHEGVAVTTLRPAGTALIEGKKVDVVSESEVIDADTRIKVVEVESNRVVVRAVRA
jgi:membrane-bound serine protease (ClpP class)